MQRKPFINLDKIINPGACFEFQGEKYDLSPVDVETFMAYSNAWFDIRVRFSEAKLSSEEYADLIFNLISSVCKTFTRDKFNKMTLAQSAAVVQLIVDVVNGTELNQDDIKKKATSMLAQKTS